MPSTLLRMSIAGHLAPRNLRFLNDLRKIIVFLLRYFGETTYYSLMEGSNNNARGTPSMGYPPVLWDSCPGPIVYAAPSPGTLVNVSTPAGRGGMVEVRIINSM